MFLTMRKVDPELHGYERRLMRFRRGSRSLGTLRANLYTAAHAHQVIGDHGQHKHLIYALELAHHHLANAAHGLGPAEGLLDQLAFTLRLRITLRPRDSMGHS
jgi:hypothetical protein